MITIEELKKTEEYWVETIENDIWRSAEGHTTLPHDSVKTIKQIVKLALSMGCVPVVRIEKQMTEQESQLLDAAKSYLFIMSGIGENPTNAKTYDDAESRLINVIKNYKENQ